MKLTGNHIVGSLVTISLISLGFIIYRRFDDSQITVNLTMVSIFSIITAIIIQFFIDVWNK